MYDNLIVHLFALYGSLKNFHYEARGMSFYGNHVFADTLIEDFAQLIDHIDNLQEVCYLGNLKKNLSWSEIAQSAYPIMVESDMDEDEEMEDKKERMQEMIEEICELLKDTKEICDKLHNGKIDSADDNLICTISQGVKNAYGLLYRVMC